MDRLLMRARHLSGQAAFEQRCLLTREDGRLVKSYRVPGTWAAGRWAMLHRSTEDILARLREEQAKTVADRVRDEVKALFTRPMQAERHVGALVGYFIG